MGKCVSRQPDSKNGKSTPSDKCSSSTEDDHPFVKLTDAQIGNPKRKLRTIHYYKNPRIHITVNKAEQVNIGDKNQSKHINLQEQHRSKSQSSSGSNSTNESALISDGDGSEKGLWSSATSHTDISDLKFEYSSLTIQDTEKVKEDKFKLEDQPLLEDLDSRTKLICSCLQQLKSDNMLQTDKKKLFQELKVNLHKDLDKIIASIEDQYVSQESIPKIPKRLKNISQHHSVHQNDYIVT